MDNLPDIKRRLKVGNLVVQSEAFQQLIKLLNHKEAADLFFDFIFETKIISDDWILRIIHELVISNALKTDQIWDESIIRTSENTKKTDFFHVGIVEICQPKYRDFLKYVQRLHSKPIFETEDIQDKFPKYCKLSKLGGEKLKRKPKNRLEVLKNCQISRLIEDDLEGLNEFNLLDLLQNRPDIVKNANFTKKLNNFFIPTVLEIVQSKLFNPADLDILKKSIIESQKSLKSFDHEKEFAQFMSRFPEERRNIRNLWILLSILPRNPEEITKRILEVVETQKETAYTVIIYFISLFGKPYFKIDRKLVIDVLTGLAVDLISLEPVIRFLCAVSNMQIPEKINVYQSLTVLMKKYPKCYEFVSPLCKTFDKSESLELFKAKLELAKECCISNDNCDEILSTLSKLLKEEDVRLASTIDIVSELCANNVLELKNTRKQLSKKIGSCTEIVTLAYCRLLAVGAIPDKEETDENNLELRLEIISELLQLTKSDNVSIANEAWKSLQKYDLQEIPKFEFPKNLQSPEVLRPWIQIELDQFPRPFFAENWQISPEFSSLDVWAAEVSRSNVHWFAENTIPMIPILMELANNGDKSAVGIKYLKLCLAKIFPITSLDQLEIRQKSWKSAISSIFLEMFEKSKNLIQSRNDICLILSNFTFDKPDNSDVLLILIALSEVFELEIRKHGILKKDDWNNKVWNWLDDENLQDSIFKNPLKTEEFVKEYCRERLLNPQEEEYYEESEEETETYSKNIKELEKLWKTSENRKEIYENLSTKSRKTWKTRKYLELEKLKGSMFLEVLQNFETNWIDCFVGLKREDNRPLPPLDWLNIMEKLPNKKKLKFACQERIYDRKIFQGLENAEILEIIDYDLTFLPPSLSQNIIEKYLDITENPDFSQNHYDFSKVLSKKKPNIRDFSSFYDPIWLKIDGFEGKKNVDLESFKNSGFLEIYMLAITVDFAKFADFLVFEYSKMKKDTENQEKLISLFYAFVLSKSPNKFFIRDYCYDCSNFENILEEVSSRPTLFKFFVEVLENPGVPEKSKNFIKDFTNFWISKDPTKINLLSENSLDYLLE
ncbi:unnamed protein product [Caenorhabditis angaria]|uniref:Uncharacterized protein n=1 Tax=Caenorhabditis angaria TaxID=860376 RepID=A0A9P1N7Z1_9PELO|nr:unnamed protein product [Caenorhabditis angaria]